MPCNFTILYHQFKMNMSETLKFYFVRFSGQDSMQQKSPLRLVISTLFKSYIGMFQTPYSWLVLILFPVHVPQACQESAQLFNP